MTLDLQEAWENAVSYIKRESQAEIESLKSQIENLKSQLADKDETISEQQRKQQRRDQLIGHRDEDAAGRLKAAEEAAKKFEASYNDAAKELADTRMRVEELELALGRHEVTSRLSLLLQARAGNVGELQPKEETDGAEIIINASGRSKPASLGE